MPTNFHRLERRLTEAVDQQFSERTRIVRQAGGNALGAQYDLSSGDIVVGVVDIDPVPLQTQDKGKYEGFMPTQNASVVHVSYDIDKFETGVDLPRCNDRLVMIDRDPELVVSIANDPEDDGLGRILCKCRVGK